MRQNRIEEMLSSVDGISDKLIEQLKKLCAAFARVYKKYNDSLTSEDDIRSECYLSVLRHVNKFDESKSKSKDVFIYSQVLNDLRSYIRKARYRVTCSAYDAINYPLEVNKANKDIHDVFLYSEMLEAPEDKEFAFNPSMFTNLSDSEFEILSKRFVENDTYAKIAQELGISTSGAYYQVRKIVNKLKHGVVK